MVEITGPYVITNPDAPTESLAKALAIKLAVSELEKISARSTILYSDEWEEAQIDAKAIIKSLLIGLGCQEVVDAWGECT